jgi:transcriptional regulator GlxA family with amidase domain
MEEVTPPSNEPESVVASAEAAEEERVSQVAVTALARRSGRSTRHGERTFATRTTPSTYR